jgi:hypothetical protein
LFVRISFKVIEAANTVALSAADQSPVIEPLVLF